LFFVLLFFKKLLDRNTFASDSIGRRGQTALTGAQVTARRVGTFATVADARILFALVNIGATSSVHQQHVTRTNSPAEKLDFFKFQMKSN
jgi:hypothetical protein